MRDKGQTGAMALLILVLMMATFIIAIAWSKYAFVVYSRTLDQVAEDKAFMVAEAGVDYLLALLNSGYTSSQVSGAKIALNIGGGIFSLEVSGGGGSASVVSTGWVGDQCQRVSGGVSSYSGALAGLGRYTRDTSSVVPMSWPCPPRPDPGFQVGSPIFVDAFDNCSANTINTSQPETSGGAWSNIAIGGGGFPIIWCNGGDLSPNCTADDEWGIFEAIPSGGLIGSSNYAVSVTQENGAGVSALLAGIQDADNMYAIEWSNDGISLLKKTTSGGWEEKASASVTVGDSTVVSMVVDGSTVKGLVDGVEYISWLDPNPFTGTGGAGLGMGDVSGVATGESGELGGCNPGQVLNNFSISGL